MVNRKLVVAVCSAAVFAVVLASHVGAMGNVSKTTYLTFNGAVRLPGVALGSGTYIFEIANPASGADVVRVLSRDRSIAYYMGFTRAVARPNGLRRGQHVSLGESAAGVAPPINTWWPENDSTGRQFIYRGN